MSVDRKPIHPSSPVGLHRVLEPAGAALPQAAQRLDASPELWPDEVRIAIETLNLDAASYRSSPRSTPVTGTRSAPRCSTSSATRGQDAEPGHRFGRHADRHRGGGRSDSRWVWPSATTWPPSSRCPSPAGHHRRPRRVGRSLRAGPGPGPRDPLRPSIAAQLPEDLSPDLALMVMDVCGAPALVARVVGEYAARGLSPTVCVLGGAGKSGSLSLAAARMPEPGAGSPWCRSSVRPTCWPGRGWPTRWSSPTPAARSACPRRWRPREDPPTSPSSASTSPGASNRHPVDRPGRHHHLLLHGDQLRRRRPGRRGRRGRRRMLVGNGYVPGHAAYALDLIRGNAAVRACSSSVCWGSLTVAARGPPRSRWGRRRPARPRPGRCRGSGRAPGPR